MQLRLLKYFIFKLDYSKGFGGKYGVQKDHVDKVFKFVLNELKLSFIKLQVSITFSLFHRVRKDGITKAKRKNMLHKKVVMQGMRNIIYFPP